jgi:RHS repeat-associated protein
MNGILARTSSGGTIAWYLTDNLGSVDNIVDTSGNVLDTIVYDSFGNIVSESDAANGDRFKFAGMQYDATVGQYFDQARWYMSGSGRFLSRDPKGFGAGDTDLYRYVGNAPTNTTDPSGLEPATMSASILASALSSTSVVMPTVGVIALNVTGIGIAGVGVAYAAHLSGQFLEAMQEYYAAQALSASLDVQLAWVHMAQYTKAYFAQYAGEDIPDPDETAILFGAYVVMGNILANAIKNLPPGKNPDDDDWIKELKKKMEEMWEEYKQNPGN